MEKIKILLIISTIGRICLWVLFFESAMWLVEKGD